MTDQATVRGNAREELKRRLIALGIKPEAAGELAEQHYRDHVYVNAQGDVRIARRRGPGFYLEPAEEALSYFAAEIAAGVGEDQRVRGMSDGEVMELKQHKAAESHGVYW